MDKITIIFFEWVLPIAIMLGIYTLIVNRAYKAYEKIDVDRIWRKVIISSLIAGFIVSVWIYITKTAWFSSVSGYTKNGAEWIANTDISQSATVVAGDVLQRILYFFLEWSPIYFRAFVLVFVLATFVLVKSIAWRIHFNRCANILLSTLILFPVLCARYFVGYQTPIFDFVQSRLFVAKLKENWNDSYFNALQGVDEKGNKFDAGSGGTAQVQRVKAATIAIRQTKAMIKTVAGRRSAEIIIRNSRETDTDRIIENGLRDLGQRIIASSIRFQDNPVLNVERGGYVFDSDVPYNSGDELGSWMAIFINPFSKYNRVSNGGLGAFKSFKSVLLGMVEYIKNLTPPSIYDRAVARELRFFKLDHTVEKAKYKAQQNLDLSVIPEPLDMITKNDIETQTMIAERVAKERIDAVSNALNAFKIHGVFDRVLVGGNSAIYKYTLPRTAELPTDFSKIAEGISRMLNIDDTATITISTAGVLSVNLANGVNIPIDFRKMVSERDKGLETVISGIAGVDAMGNNILVNLGDRTPHAILYGTTGRGKTVTIMSILYSAMAATDPSSLRIAYIDGKGNSFEFMRTDNKESSNYHPNPFTFAQPADASGDIEYARALLRYMMKETRRRIELFKQRGVSDIGEFNERYPEEKLYEILLLVDEFSAITDLDDMLSSEDLPFLGTVDAFEYEAKMARSTGIRMLLANQTARKEKVPGRITANVGGRISLGVAEGIESNMALPDSGVQLNMVTQAGEFYSALNSIRNPEHGNTPFLSMETRCKLNDSLEKRFGHHDYVVTRDEIMREFYTEEEEEKLYNIPDPMPTKETGIKELLYIIEEFPEWAKANKDSLIFKENKDVNSNDPLEKRRNAQALKRALKKCGESGIKKVI
ncbi:FtsK/SpoIIIE domain-containing protein [Listeria booriae]|nr:FtsK/SpoIIIE domain-containing protein [Listeria booriae]